MDFNKTATASKKIHDPGPDRLSTTDCEHQYRADWDSTVPYWMCQLCGDKRDIVDGAI